ncbi:MAG: 6-carboxytetrahydropterin synthase [Nitrospiraceae bacterium]
MSEVLLTKGIEFAAAHRYAREEWSEARNREAFGACFNDPGHGHNYFLEVTVAGAVDRQTGMVVNLYDLKVVLKQVLEEFDHKHLNLDTPYFKDRIPTTENIARVLWRCLERHRNIGRLHTVKLVEDEDLAAAVRGSVGLDRAAVTRRYSFLRGVGRGGRSAGPDLRAYDSDLFITVEGAIDEITGMVTDLRRLDQLVREQVLPGLQSAPPSMTGEQLAQRAWHLLTPSLSGAQLELVRLVESRDLFYDYSGDQPS